MTLTHLELFLKIKKFLQSQLPDATEVFEDTLLIVNAVHENESALWMEYDPEGEDLTVGFGIAHQHFYQHIGDDLNEGFQLFLTFLTSKRREVDYFKGKMNYKSDFQFQKEDGTFETFGTNITFLYPFWKKKRVDITEQPALLNIQELKQNQPDLYSFMSN